MQDRHTFLVRFLLSIPSRTGHSYLRKILYTSLQGQVRSLLLRYPKPPRRRSRALRRSTADQRSHRRRNQIGHTTPPNHRGWPQPRRRTGSSYRLDDRTPTSRFVRAQRIRTLTREGKVGEFFLLSFLVFLAHCGIFVSTR